MTSISYYLKFCNRIKRIKLQLPDLFFFLSETKCYYVACTALTLQLTSNSNSSCLSFLSTWMVRTGDYLVEFSPVRILTSNIYLLADIFAINICKNPLQKDNSNTYQLCPRIVKRYLITYQYVLLTLIYLILYLQLERQEKIICKLCSHVYNLILIVFTF